MKVAQVHLLKAETYHSGKGVLNEPIFPPEELQCSSQRAVMVFEPRDVQQRHLDIGIRASKVLL